MLARAFRGHPVENYENARPRNDGPTAATTANIYAAVYRGSRGRQWHEDH